MSAVNPGLFFEFPPRGIVQGLPLVHVTAGQRGLAEEGLLPPLDQQYLQLAAPDREDYEVNRDCYSRRGRASVAVGDHEPASLKVTLTIIDSRLMVIYT